MKTLDNYQIGDKVKHNWFDDVATITAKRQAHTMGEIRWLYTLDFGHTVTGPFGNDYNGGEFLAEAITLCEPEYKPIRIKGVCFISGQERKAWTRHMADAIRHKAQTAETTKYCHNEGRIEASIAYRNDSNDPDEMSYRVCWYDSENNLKECENGIYLWQAALHMADFHLLAEAGLTLQEILYPGEKAA